MGYQSKHTGTTIDKNIDIINEFLNKTYPIGSIYMNINNINPGTLFGGTWEQIQDRFLLAAGGTYNGGTIGGSANHNHTTAGHTLTINEMPNHQHDIMNNNGKGSNGLCATNVSSGTDGGNWCFRDVGVDASNNASGDFMTTFVGGGESHSHGDTGSSSNLPPYLTVYIWKRIA